MTGKFHVLPVTMTGRFPRFISRLGCAAYFNIHFVTIVSYNIMGFAVPKAKIVRFARVLSTSFHSLDRSDREQARTVLVITIPSLTTYPSFVTNTCLRPSLRKSSTTVSIGVVS